MVLTNLFSLAGCGAPAGSDSTAESVLIYASGADATTLDPADAEDGESVKVIVNVFDTLLTYADDSADLVPGLATKWSESPDRLEWTFELRDGVQFHDGTPFNAEAVVFTLGRLIDPNHPHRHDAKLPLGSDYQVIETVEATDPRTVLVRLKHPSGVLLRNLAMFPSSIVSPTAVQKEGENFKIRPVGTGPFHFQEWIANEKLVLGKNPDYWRGPVAVEQIIFKPIAEPAARLRQLETGEIDMADGLSIPVREEIRSNPHLRLATSPGMNIGYFAMNMDHPPFGDARVRRAIAHAIDKRAILASAYDNAGQITSTPLPPTLWGADPEIADYPFDPGRARELLKEAGVAPGTKIGFWAMRNSRPYMPTPEKVAAVIQQQLREVGLEPVIQSPPWSQYLSQTGNGEHDVCLMGWSTDNADPDNFLYTLLDKDNASPPNANNLSFYRSEPLHDLLIRAQRESDQAKRIQLYKEAQRIIREDCPMIPLVSLEMATGLGPRVKEYELHPTGIVFLRNVSMVTAGN